MFRSGRNISRWAKQQQQLVIYGELKLNITNFSQWLRNSITWYSDGSFIFLCGRRGKGWFMDAIHYRRCMVCFQFISHRPRWPLSPDFHQLKLILVPNNFIDLMVPIFFLYYNNLYERRVSLSLSTYIYIYTYKLMGLGRKSRGEGWWYLSISICRLCILDCGCGWWLL